MNREMIADLEAEYLEKHPGTAGTVKPFVYDKPEDVIDNKQFPFPIITDLLLDEDWEEVGKTWFVDSSGYGSPGEPALTGEAFEQELLKYVRLNPDHGFGLSGVGQFQVYVSAYRRIR